jgi:2'-5' RNA ligase
MPSLTQGESLYRRTRDDQLLYLMLKPSLPAADAMDLLRLEHGMSRKYGADRFHITLVPFGDIRTIPPDMLTEIRCVLASLRTEPFEISLNRISGNALVGSRMLALRDFRKTLIARLEAAGIYLPDYDFRPHASLCYSEWVQRSIPVSPIRWRVDELLLINSVHGKGHTLVESWDFEPRQGAFDF